MPNPADSLIYAPKPPEVQFLPPQPSYAKFDDLAKSSYASAPFTPTRPVVRTVDEDEARAALLRAIVDHPKRVNPTAAGGGCVNTSVLCSRHHCVAAQVVNDLGLPLPTTGENANGGGAATLMNWLRDKHGVRFTQGAIDLLARAQNAADGDATNIDPDGWLLAVGRALVKSPSPYAYDA